MIVTLRKTAERHPLVVEIRRRTGTVVFPMRVSIDGIEAAARQLKTARISSGEISALLLLAATLDKKKAAPAFVTYRIDSGTTP